MVKTKSYRTGVSFMVIHEAKTSPQGLKALGFFGVAPPTSSPSFGAFSSRVDILPQSCSQTLAAFL